MAATLTDASRFKDQIRYVVRPIVYVFHPAPEMRKGRTYAALFTLA